MCRSVDQLILLCQDCDVFSQPSCIPLRKQRKLADRVGAESAAQQRSARFQHPIEGATLPDLGCLSIQRYGACYIRPLEAGAAVLVHRGFVWIALAKQAPFVDWMERVDKHVRPVKRNPSCDATIAEIQRQCQFR
jgi:hypothetical protein